MDQRQDHIKTDDPAEDPAQGPGDDIFDKMDAAHDPVDGQSDSYQSDENAGQRIEIKDGHCDEEHAEDMPAREGVAAGLLVDDRFQIEHFIGTGLVDPVPDDTEQYE